MTTLEQAARQALEALESSRVFVTTREKIKHPEGTEAYDEIIASLRQALEQPTVKDCLKVEPKQEQKPVAWISGKSLAEVKDFDATAYGRGGFDDAVPLYTEPPQREWVGLTTEQKIGIWEEYSRLTDSIIPTPEALFKVIETLLKEKNA